MKERMKQWAQARMAPRTWDKLGATTANAAKSVQATVDRGRRWAVIGSDRVISIRTARIEPWRLAFAAISVLVPVLLLALVRYNTSIADPALLLLFSVAISVYVADWVGGVTAVACGVISMDLLFAGDRFTFDLFSTTGGPGTLIVFLIASGLLIAVIEHLKYQHSQARMDSAAMRAANTALTAVEIAAAQRPPGDTDALLSVIHSILTAMVQVNRASSGAMYLADATGTTFVRAVVYGEPSAASDGFLGLDTSHELKLGEGFVGRVASERRALTVFDTLQEHDVEDVLNSNPHVRSVVGVPLIGPTDNVVGVAWVGVYLPYRFGATATARLQALGHRTVAFMEAARLADAQEELLDRVQDHHRRLQAVIQTMPEAVMVVRPPKGVIVASNAAAQRMFDIRADGHVLLTRASQLKVTGEHDEVLPILTALQTGEVVTGVELSVRTPSGRSLPVVASAAPLLSEDGSIDAVVGVFQDVTSLKEAERLRDEFVSIVSHELRSPLTPIRGFAQVVERELLKDGQHPDLVVWLQTLQRHADRMTRLVDDLLDVSRLRAGRLEIRRGHTDLVRMCRSVIDSRQPTSEQHVLRLDSDESELLANVDDDRIHQVVDNLVGNALKYTDSGIVTVGLHVSADGANALITVRDQGRGIPAEERNYLFNPFYRSRDVSESAVPGLGLGLFICSELIQAHDGTIDIGDAPGGGTIFSIVLPRNLPLDTRISA
jgi:PAS domain S-box-containing protein